MELFFWAEVLYFTLSDFRVTRQEVHFFFLS